MNYSACYSLFQSTQLCASEAHGIATGLLCMDNCIQPAQWLAEVAPQTAQTLSEQTTALLVELFNSTHELLTQNEFAFTLFLPSDDTPLSIRLQALVSWCQGFLLGVSMISRHKRHSAQTQEILKDIIEFTKLDTTSDGHEDDEIALAEIIEYLRSAVLLLRDEQH